MLGQALGLKDEESARKLFYSNTFDFTGMGSVLTKKLIKELQSLALNIELVESDILTDSDEELTDNSSDSSSHEVVQH